MRPRRGLKVQLIDRQFLNQADNIQPKILGVRLFQIVGFLFLVTFFFLCFTGWDQMEDGTIELYRNLGRAKGV